MPQGLGITDGVPGLGPVSLRPMTGPFVPMIMDGVSDLPYEAQDAVMRMAGATPLPEELDAVRRLLLHGEIGDHTGSVRFTPGGGLEIEANNGFGLTVNPGYDPGAEVRFQTRF